MRVTRLTVFSSLLVIAALLATGTVYAYGRWFSHDRYWYGTIASVQQTDAKLIRDLLDEVLVDSALPTENARLSRMFGSMYSKLIIEVSVGNDAIYSNFNKHFSRGQLLDSVQIKGGGLITLSSYAPPSWNRNFARWLQNPVRWFEPSFDHVTFPFLWFLAIYILALFGFGFAIKSNYLEKDVLAVLRKHGHGGSA